MALDKEKFKNLVHLICWRMGDDPSSLGSVKLNKTLWLSDFVHYYQTGGSITGARYIKRQYGPVPSPILNAQQELAKEGKIEVQLVPYFGRSKSNFLVKKQPETRIFSDDELSIIDAAIEFVCLNNTAKSISDLSHDHIWKAAKNGEEIPYFTVFAVPGEITESEREWARTQIECFAT